MVSPTMAGQSHKIGLADFTFTDNDEPARSELGKGHIGDAKAVKEQIMRLWGHARQSFKAFGPAITGTGQLLQQPT